MTMTYKMMLGEWVMEHLLEVAIIVIIGYIILRYLDRHS